MKKSTARIVGATGLLLVLAVLLVPLFCLPNGFALNGEPIVKRYLRGASLLAARFGANSGSSRLREVVRATPASRMIFQYDYDTDAEREAIDRAVWAYPLDHRVKVSFLLTEVDWDNKKYVVEAERTNKAWFDAEVAKVKGKFGKKP